MIRDIRDRFPVSLQVVVETQFVARRERVANSSGQRSGITFLGVLAYVGQLNCRTSGVVDFLRRPYDFVEAFQPAMKRVFAVVHGEFVFLAIQREAALRDSISVAPNDRTKVWIL